jgi:hypothetical protein
VWSFWCGRYFRVSEMLLLSLDDDVVIVLLPYIECCIALVSEVWSLY